MTIRSSHLGSSSPMGCLRRKAANGTAFSTSTSRTSVRGKRSGFQCWHPSRCRMRRRLQRSSIVPCASLAQWAPSSLRMLKGQILVNLGPGCILAGCCGLGRGRFHPTWCRRSRRRALRSCPVQIAQYTVDTTFCVGSLIGAGVLDRFPSLRLLLSHGGGTFPYLTGRFDCMHAAELWIAPLRVISRMSRRPLICDASIMTLSCTIPRSSAGWRSEYRLAGSRSAATIHSRRPILIRLGMVRKAGFSATEVQAIVNHNPRTLFPRLNRLEVWRSGIAR